MAVYCRGSNVADIYRQGAKVSQIYKGGALVYEANPYAYGGYIKEGLIFQLDCAQNKVVNYVEDGVTYKALKNLVVGGNVVLYNHTDDGETLELEDVKFGSGGGILVSGKSLQDMDILYGIDNPQDIAEIEVCCKCVSKVQQTDDTRGIGVCYIDLCSATFEIQDIGFYFEGYGWYDTKGISYGIGKIGSDVYDYVPTIQEQEIGSIITYHVNATSASKNGVSLTLSDKSIMGSVSQNVMANFFGTWEIYSIRAYNRVLENDERNANRAIDQTRFNKAQPVYLYGGDALKLYGGNNVNLYK